MKLPSDDWNTDNLQGQTIITETYQNEWKRNCQNELVNQEFDSDSQCDLFEKKNITLYYLTLFYDCQRVAGEAKQFCVLNASLSIFTWVCTMVTWHCHLEVTCVPSPIRDQQLAPWVSPVLNVRKWGSKFKKGHRNKKDEGVNSTRQRNEKKWSIFYIWNN